MSDGTAENWFDFEGHRVFYRREGAGDRLLFRPNAPLTGRLWQHQAAYFRSRYEVLTVDMPGLRALRRDQERGSRSTYTFAASYASCRTWNSRRWRWWATA